jgi:hypothetical protein
LKRWLLPPAGPVGSLAAWFFAAWVHGAAAQGSDAAYCEQLIALAYRYVGSSGGDGRNYPDLNTLGAISDCRKGNTARGIPYLEKKLRDSHITLPPRS